MARSARNADRPSLIEPKTSVCTVAPPTCRKDFTVTTRTVMERSHAKLTQWAAAFHMGASSKKGIIAHQLHRAVGVARIRPRGLCAPHLRSDAPRAALNRRLAAAVRLSKSTKPIFAKFRKRPGLRAKCRVARFRTIVSGTKHKRAIIALVERGGSVRSFPRTECLRRHRECQSCARTFPAKVASAYRRKPPLLVSRCRVRCA